jgi:hypothetical protein
MVWLCVCRFVCCQELGGFGFVTLQRAFSSYIIRHMWCVYVCACCSVCVAKNLTRDESVLHYHAYVVYVCVYAVLYVLLTLKES